MLAVELRPKKVAVRFKISLARRSSRTSCSRALTRAASSVETPGTAPRACLHVPAGTGLGTGARLESVTR